MNNCEKCGNPLQPGLTTCPICGTTAKSLDAAVTAQPMTNESIEALDEPPIASAPLIDPNVPVTPPQVDMVEPNAVPITPAQPMDIVAPATPVPLPEGTPSFESPTQSASTAQPAMFTDTGFTGMDINAATPAANVTLDVPATAAPQTPSTPVQPSASEKKEAAPKTEKKSNNTILIVIVALAALGLGVGAGFLLSSSMTKPVQTPTTVAESNETSEGGYTFKIEDGWTPTTINGKLVITNKDDDVTLRFTTNSGQFSSINASNIEVSLSTKEGYTEVTTEKTTLGEKDVVIANAKNGDIYIQYYYTAHDVSNIIYATAIYETQEAKNNNEEKVKTIIESIKYTEEIQNAIQAITPHSQIYDDAVTIYFESFAKEEPNSNE